MFREKMGRESGRRESLKREDLRELGSLHHGPPLLVWLIEREKKHLSWHIKAPTCYSCGLDNDLYFVFVFVFVSYFWSLFISLHILMF